jgi:hypothetical protein
MFKLFVFIKYWNEKIRKDDTIIFNEVCQYQ